MLFQKRYQLATLICCLLTLVNIDCNASGKGRGKRKAATKTEATTETSTAVRTAALMVASSALNSDTSSSSSEPKRRRTRPSLLSNTTSSSSSSSSSSLTHHYGDLDLLLAEQAQDEPMRSFTVPAWDVCAMACLDYIEPYFMSLARTALTSDATLDAEAVQERLQERFHNIKLLETVTELNVSAIAPEHQSSFWKLIKELMQIHQAIETSGDKSPAAINAILQQSNIFVWLEEFMASTQKLRALRAGTLAFAVAYGREMGEVSSIASFANSFLNILTLSSLIKRGMNTDSFTTKIPHIKATLKTIHDVLTKLQVVTLPPNPCPEAQELLGHYGLVPQGPTRFCRS